MEMRNKRNVCLGLFCFVLFLLFYLMSFFLPYFYEFNLSPFGWLVGFWCGFVCAPVGLVFLQETMKVERDFLLLLGRWWSGWL